MTTKIKPFLILDAFRGFACLWVVAYHMSEVLIARYPELRGTLLYRATDQGNAGVQMFFVISGYCIASAMSGALRKEGSFGYFVKARVRRIYPTAMIAITLGLLYSVAAASFVSHGMVASSTAADKGVLTRGPEYFLVNYTLTNCIFPQDFVLVQCWTLCYEVAFYLIVGLAMLALRTRFSESTILHALHALTIAALGALIVNPHSLHYPLDLWPEFGLGVIVYDLIRTRYARPTVAWAAAAGLATLALIVLRNSPLGTMEVLSRTQYAISLGFTALLLVCHRYDAKISSWSVSRALGWVGLFSYSLYLTHTFSIGVFNQIVKHLNLPMQFHYVVFLSVIVAATLFGRFFFTFCEKPFMSSKAKKIHEAIQHSDTDPAPEIAEETPRVSAPAGVVD